MIIRGPRKGTDTTQSHNTRCLQSDIGSRPWVAEFDPAYGILAEVVFNPILASSPTAAIRSRGESGTTCPQGFRPVPLLTILIQSKVRAAAGLVADVRQVCLGYILRAVRQFKIYIRYPTDIDCICSCSERCGMIQGCVPLSCTLIEALGVCDGLDLPIIAS
jgi:hypothetical protein